MVSVFGEYGNICVWQKYEVTTNDSYFIECGTRTHAMMIELPPKIEVIANNNVNVNTTKLHKEY